MPPVPLPSPSTQSKVGQTGKPRLGVSQRDGPRRRSRSMGRQASRISRPRTIARTSVGRAGSVDRPDVGADERCLLLVDGARAAVRMALLEVGKGCGRSNRIDLVITVVVE